MPATASLTEAITESFYAWETRGRGWSVARYPVSLEPPFRPFLLLPEHAAARLTPIDDGRRPTIGSMLVDGVKALFAPSAPPAAVAYEFEEEDPFPAFEVDELVAHRVLVPHEFSASPGLIVQCLAALSSTVHPIAFELVGTESHVHIQLVCADVDAERVCATLEAFMPGVSVAPGDDLLHAGWSSDASHSAVDFGLGSEFFLPLPSGRDLSVDPYVALVPALARAGKDELLVFQFLIEPVRNPWTTAIRDALDDGEGGCSIGDAPWMLRAASDKTETPLYATVARVFAQARTDERAEDLVRGTGSFIRQFTRAGGNELVPLANVGYPDDIHAKSILYRESFRTGMVLSADELAALVHIPNDTVRHPALVRGELRSKPLPGVARGHELVLGLHHYQGEESEATLPHESRFAHTWIIGGSGTGKSTLLTNLILQDIEAGHGLAVFDPHGDLVDDIAARIPESETERVILFDPADTEYPVGFNILEAETETERDLLASDLVGVFRRLATSWGDTMSTVLGNAVLALLLHPKRTTLLDVRRFLIDERFRAQVLAAIPDPDVQYFWEKEYGLIGAKSIGPLLSRLDAFLRPRIIRNIVGQANAKLDVAKVVARGQVLLAKLGKGMIGEENSALLGSLLLARFNQLALARQRLPKEERRPFFLYIDEFQNFVTPSMESLATEGRKYRFGLVLAHQTLAQLADVPRIESAVLGNCHTRIIFRVGESDAKRLAEGFAFFEAADLLGLARGEAIVRIGAAANDFSIRTYPTSTVDEEVARERLEALLERTHTLYAVPREELVASLRDASEPARARIDEKREPQAELPVLERAPPTQPVDAKAVPTRRRTLSAPEVAAPKSPGRGGEMHKYLQHLIKRLAEERGFRAVVEGAAGEGQADVILVRDDIRVGCEVSVTTSVLHEEENLRKCLSAGFTRVIFIAAEKRQRDKVAAMVRTSLADAPIDVIGPEDIVTALDALGEAPQARESVVRGYKVKVKRQDLSPGDVASKRRAVAEVIAKTMRTKPPDRPTP